MSRPPGPGLVGLALGAWAGLPAHAPAQFPAEFYIEDLVGRGAQLFLGRSQYEIVGNDVAAGDVNGDGFVDLLMASPGAAQATVRRLGAVYVVFGGPGLTGVDVFDLARLDGSNGFRIEGLNPEDQFAWKLLSGVDLN